MSQHDSYNIPHDTEVKRVEGLRQSAVRAAGVTQAQVITAEIAYYRAVLASAITNTGRNQGSAIHALWQLGVRDV
jgi:hypothetical protein